MYGLLDIFGRAITVDTPELIWGWLQEHKSRWSETDPQHRHLGRIVDLIGKGLLDEANDQLRLYLFEHPSCCFGRMAAAALSLRAENLNETIEELNSVYLRQPNNTLALYVLGHCYERLGYQAQAVEFYQDCLKFKGYLQLPAQRLAAIYFKEGRVEDAIDQYEPMRQHYPDDISTLVTLGHLYLVQGRHAQAAQIFNIAILIHPDNFVTQDESVDALIRDGQIHEALDRLEILLADQPDKPDLVAKHAEVLAMLGATSDAISQYQRALRLCPDFLEATIKLGTIYLKMHAEHLAAQQFNQAVEINDKIVEAYTGLAAAQKLAGRTAEAMNTLSLAAAIQPNSAFLFAETAKLILKAAYEANLVPLPEDGRTLEHNVVLAHQQHLQRLPQNPDLHYRLGILWMNAVQHDRALDCFQNALRINPTFARAATKLAASMFETGRRDDALELIMPPRRYDPRTLDLYYRTALLYCNRIKFASSVINLQRQIEANLRTNLDPTHNISIVLQNLGLSDTVGLMWENLCQTAAHASAPTR
jgi:tetratricopeptide (TPR) repeat protein